MIVSMALFAQISIEWKIIHAGTLLADARGEVLTEQDIIFRRNPVIEVRDGYLALDQVGGMENARVTFVKGHFVLAGLIDAHAHNLG